MCSRVLLVTVVERGKFRTILDGLKDVSLNKALEISTTLFLRNLFSSTSYYAYTSL